MKKLTKILPLVALGIASLFAFSGCDKILETFYPDETGGGQSGDEYGITLRVNVDTVAVPSWGAQMVVRLESGDDGFAAQQRSGFAYNAPGTTTATWVVSFDFIPDSDYRVFAWLDVDGNRLYDPATEASAGRDWFHVPFWDPMSGNQIDHPEFPVDLVPVAGDNAKVTLDVLLDKASFPSWNTEDLVVELKQMERQWFRDPVRHGTAVEMLSNHPLYDPNMALWEVEYDLLPTGTYRMTAWVDANHNSVWEQEDEVGAVVVTDHGEIFPIPYYNPWEGPDATYPKVLSVTLWQTDPSFEVVGPASIDRSSPGYADFWIYPAAADNTFSYVRFRILDDLNKEPVGYYGNWEYQSVSDSYPSDGNSYTFGVDFFALNPALDDMFWDDKSSVIVEVTGTYENGTSFMTEYYVALNDSSAGGTYFDLMVNTAFDITAPWGYAYVYIVDHAYQNTLSSYSYYLDGSGSYPFGFYGLYDPEGLDQDVQVYLYDQYWNYIGYYVYVLSGDFAGYYTLGVDDFGAWTPGWM